MRRTWCSRQYSAALHTAAALTVVRHLTLNKRKVNFKVATLINSIICDNMEIKSIALITIMIIILGCKTVKQPTKEDYKILINEVPVLIDTIMMSKFKILLPRNGIIETSRSNYLRIQFDKRDEVRVCETSNNVGNKVMSCEIIFLMTRKEADAGAKIVQVDEYENKSLNITYRAKILPEDTISYFFTISDRDKNQVIIMGEELSEKGQETIKWIADNVSLN